ncbi:MAG: thioredoxin family protein [Chloroflexota bacterium]
MKIKILGPGCHKCDELEQVTKEVLGELKVEASVEHVRDMNKIMEYPILKTPGLVINEKLVVSGRVPTKAEVNTFITTALVNEEKT